MASPDRSRGRQRARKGELAEQSQAPGAVRLDSPTRSPLDRAARALRAKLASKAAQEVWDAAISEDPGKAALRLVQAIALSSAYDIARCTMELRLAVAPSKRGRKHPPETIAGLVAMLEMARDNTAALKRCTDALMRAAKVASEIDLDTLPDEVRFIGVTQAWAAQLATDLVDRGEA